MEEYINGLIISYDGMANMNKEVVFETSHVFPNPIMDVVNEGGSMYYYSLRELPEDLKAAGRACVKTFYTAARCFHMEFFRMLEDKEGLGKKGDIIGLEVNMRCPGGYTPDMINFARSVNSYRVWAEVMTYGHTNEYMDHPKFYCGYYARRWQNHYTHSAWDIYNRFQNKIVMHEQMPEAFAGAMGNDAYFIKTDSFEELMEFKKYCSE
jgi:hypothetical protein